MVPQASVVSADSCVREDQPQDSLDSVVRQERPEHVRLTGSPQHAQDFSYLDSVRNRLSLRGLFPYGQLKGLCVLVCASVLI